MCRHVKSMTPLLWVIAFALLVVQTADAHVHLCLDGQEQRSSFHVVECAPVCHKSDGTHQDQDVDALGAVLAQKNAQPDTLGPLPVDAIVLLLLPPPQRGSDYCLATTQDPSPKLPELFLPLLRGPPV